MMTTTLDKLAFLLVPGLAIIIALLGSILVSVERMDTKIDTNLRLISAALADKGPYGGPLQRIDHNLAIIGDYGIPQQQPNAPKVVR